MPMTTKVVNQTGSSINLMVGAANVFRTLHHLPDGSTYPLKVDENATHRDYKFAADDDKYVLLSAADCMDYEEVRIKVKEEDKTMYTWDAVKRHSHELVKDARDKEAFNQHPADASSAAILGPSPSFLRNAWNKIKRSWSS